MIFPVFEVALRTLSRLCYVFPLALSADIKGGGQAVSWCFLKPWAASGLQKKLLILASIMHVGVYMHHHCRPSEAGLWLHVLFTLCHCWSGPVTLSIFA